MSTSIVERADDEGGPFEGELRFRMRGFPQITQFL
jgi:hypothetical protein